MGRAPFQVLVIPYRRLGPKDQDVQFAIVRRRDYGFWHWIAGGGEGDETTEQAAERELREETGVDSHGNLVRLQSVAPIPRSFFRDSDAWDSEMLIIPEYSFGVELYEEVLHISREHTEYRWVSYWDAEQMVRFDSNRTALWELATRLGLSVEAIPRRGSSDGS